MLCPPSYADGETDRELTVKNHLIAPFSEFAVLFAFSLTGAFIREFHYTTSGKRDSIEYKKLIAVAVTGSFFALGVIGENASMQTLMANGFIYGLIGNNLLESDNAVSNALKHQQHRPRK